MGDERDCVVAAIGVTHSGIVSIFEYGGKSKGPGHNQSYTNECDNKTRDVIIL
jgi:hypothetical protein